MTITEPRPAAAAAGGLNPDEVFVAGMQRLWVANVGTPFPDDIDEDPGEGWTDCGYTTEDGFTATFGITTENLMTSQSLAPVRVLVTEKPTSFTASLRQLNRVTLPLALGGGAVTGDDSSWHYTPPPSSFIDERAFILEGEDGDHKLRFMYYRASISAEVAIPMVNTDSVTLPLTFSVLAHDPLFEIDGSGPGFAGGPLTVSVAAEADGADPQTATVTTSS
jgi:hypothetical protein